MSDYLNGFVAGIQEAARTLREAAREHHERSTVEKTVLGAQAEQLAAALLASWANGLDMNADRALRKGASQ